MKKKVYRKVKCILGHGFKIYQKLLLHFFRNAWIENQRPGWRVVSSSHSFIFWSCEKCIYKNVHFEIYTDRYYNLESIFIQKAGPSDERSLYLTDGAECCILVRVNNFAPLFYLLLFHHHRSGGRLVTTFYITWQL